MDFEGNEIAPIRLDRGGKHIGWIVAVAMRTERQQKAEDASLLLVCTATHKSAPKSRRNGGASVYRNSLLIGGRARDCESGFVSRKKAIHPPLYVSDVPESSKA